MRISLNRHLRAAAAVIALLGMLVLSTGASLVLAAGSANAATSKSQSGDCGGEDQGMKVAKVDDGGGGCGGCQGDGGGQGDRKLAKDNGEDDCNPCDVIIIGKRSTQEGDDECIAPDPEVTFTDPSCENESTASWNGTGEHSTFELTEGTVGPGEEVTVEAHTVFPYKYDNGKTSMEFNHTFGPAVTPQDCVEPTVVVPTDPSFTEPTCDTDGTVVVPNDPPADVSKKATGPVILTSDAGGVHYVVTGSLKAGETAYVDATALPGFVIQEGAPVHWDHTFAMPQGCTVVQPPVVDPPVVQPTVVEAGLVGDVAAALDPRAEQGRILVALGLALLVVAGGLVLRPSSSNSR